MIDRCGEFADPFHQPARDQMLHLHLAGRGIRDPRVLAAFAAVPREAFVPLDRQADAYADHPLEIGLGQTISQPYMVAAMTVQLRLEGRERVLEIGTGSGYQTAILARLAGEVYSIERHPPLQSQAAAVLRRLGFTGVHLQTGDGSLGWPEQAPFDRILITCAVPRAPATLMMQLADGGRLVAPVGYLDLQRLMIVDRQGDDYKVHHGEDCRFVPLIGRDGFAPPSAVGGARA